MIFSPVSGYPSDETWKECEADESGVNRNTIESDKTPVRLPLSALQHSFMCVHVAKLIVVTLSRNKFLVVDKLEQCYMAF